MAASLHFPKRSYWIPGSSAPTVPEKCTAFARPLKNKGFAEEKVTTMRLDDLDTSTTLGSNKSHTFQWLIQQVDGRMIVLSDTAFHAAEGDPANLKLCQRGEWEDRMLVETVLSMLTLVCHFKKVMHRAWAYFQARLAFTMALCNVLVQWQGLRPTASGFVPLSIAEFSL